MYPWISKVFCNLFSCGRHRYNGSFTLSNTDKGEDGRSVGYKRYLNSKREPVRPLQCQRSPIALNKNDANRQLMTDLGFDDVTVAGAGFFGTVFCAQATNTTFKQLGVEWIGLERPVLDAIDQEPERRLAVKCISHVREVLFLESFWKEANQLASIRHPNIVRQFAAFQLFARVSVEKSFDRRFELVPIHVVTPPADHERLFCVILMERLGNDLEKIVKECCMAPASEREIRHIFREIGAALEHLHGLSLIHNDLRLANIVTTYVGDSRLRREQFCDYRLKLVDFGIAVAYDSTRYRSATESSNEALIKWQGEVVSLERRMPLQPTISNAFLREAFAFGRMLMKLSVPSRFVSFRYDSPSMPELFQEHSILKDASLRKALMMMASKDEYQRITMEHALAMVEAGEV